MLRKQTWLTWDIWLALPIMATDALIARQFATAFVALATLDLSLAPVVVARWAAIHVPASFMLMVVAFAFCFALAIGAGWEVFEYATDRAFGLNMQKSGLDDTMGDLVTDVVGAGPVSWAAWGRYPEHPRQDVTAPIDLCRALAS